MFRSSSASRARSRTFSRVRPPIGLAPIGSAREIAQGLDRLQQVACRSACGASRHADWRPITRTRTSFERALRICIIASPQPSERAQDEERVATEIEEVIEPYLLQLAFVQRTPRGRTLTPAAYKHLGIAVPVQSQTQQLSLPGADEDSGDGAKDGEVDD